MKETTITMSTLGVSDWIEVDRRGSAHQIFTLAIDMTAGAGMASVEFAVQKELGQSTLAITHDVLDNVTTSCASRQTSPVTAFRLNILSHSGGDIILRILQAGYFGN